MSALALPKLLMAAGAGLLAMTVVLGAYQHGVDTTRAKCEVVRLREVAAVASLMEQERQRADEAAADYELAREQRQVVTRTITKEIVREVEKPVYRECRVPVDGVRLINAARRGAEAERAREPVGPLPADPTAAGS